MGASVSPLDIANPILGLWQNERSLEVQRNTNAQNRAWQSSENQLDREFQAAQQESLLQSQQDFQKEMFELQNQYNLPANVIARLRSAGINPAALLGSSSAGLLGSQASVPSVPSAPGSVGSHSVSPQGIDTPMNSISQMFSSIAQLQDAVSNAELSGARADEIRKMLPGRIRDLEKGIDVKVSEENLNKVAYNLQSFELELQRIYGSEKRVAEINEIMNRSYMEYAQGNAAEAQQLYYRGIDMLNQLDYKIKDAQYPELIKQAGMINDIYKEQAATERAKQSEAYAAAEEHKAGAALKSEQTESVELDNDFNTSTFQSRIVQLMNEAKASEKLPEQVENQIKLQLKELEWADAEHRAGIVGKIISSLGAAIGAGAGAFIGVKGLQLRSVKPSSVKGFKVDRW